MKRKISLGQKSSILFYKTCHRMTTYQKSSPLSILHLLHSHRQVAICHIIVNIYVLIGASLSSFPLNKEIGSIFASFSFTNTCHVSSFGSCTVLASKPLLNKTTISFHGPNDFTFCRWYASTSVDVCKKSYVFYKVCVL